MVVAALTCIVAALERPASDSATRVTTGGTASPSAGARRMLVALKTATSGVQGGLAGARLLFAAASFRKASVPHGGGSALAGLPSCFHLFAYADAPVGDFAFQTLRYHPTPRS